ncbi:hypothetical protein VUR80DRAFT_4036 [Thermomyces stellatus]
MAKATEETGHDEGEKRDTKPRVPSDTAERAQTAADAEHNLPPLAAIKRYPRAVAWCLVISMCVVMEGYDLNLLTNFFAYPEFAKKFGTYNAETDNYQLSAPWQAAFTNAASVGAFFGTLLNGYLVTRWGHVRVLIGALCALSAFIFITFFAPDNGVLLAGQILCGLPWGVFATAAPAYASEVLPMSLRVYLTSWTNMCFIIGQLISAGILAGLVNIPNQWSYRIPFAIQWVWPVVLIPTIWFAPDTPWYLVRAGRIDDARASLQGLRPGDSEAQIEDMLSLIRYTNDFEEELAVGTSYWDCFKGFELRRTEIACVAFMGQVLAGMYFAYNSTYFFQQIGLNVDQTYRLNLGGTGMALFATILSWLLVMPYAGRRTTYLCGLSVMTAILIIIGGLNVRTGNDKVAMTQAVLTLVWTFAFQLSVGQLGWAIPSEVGSTRLRQRTICLARNAYSIAAIVAGVIQPYFMNPTQLNLKGYTGFVWGGVAFLTLVWAYFRLPETRNRTYDELDLLFARRVSARKFASYQIDLLRVDNVHASEIIYGAEKSGVSV